MEQYPVVGVLLVGAEGCAEVENKPWVRKATDEEEKTLQDRVAAKLDSGDYRDAYVDGNGRPYWVLAVLDHPETPKIAREKAEQYDRVLRLTY